MRHGRDRVFQICARTGEHWSRGISEPVPSSTRRATIEPATGSLSRPCYFRQRFQFQSILPHLLPPPLQNVAQPIRVESPRPPEGQRSYLSRNDSVLLWANLETNRH